MKPPLRLTGATAAIAQPAGTVQDGASYARDWRAVKQQFNILCSKPRAVPGPWRSGFNPHGGAEARLCAREVPDTFAKATLAYRTDTDTRIGGRMAARLPKSVQHFANTC